MIAAARPSSIKRVDPTRTCCGPAYTVTCVPGDNLLLQVARSCASVGRVVVLWVGGFRETGALGDMLATACHTKDLTGFVTDASARSAPPGVLERTVHCAVWARPRDDIESRMSPDRKPSSEPTTLGWSCA
ncbi:MAG: hypothetical protein ACREO8_08530 [Luteimonas sp.]